MAILIRNRQKKIKVNLPEIKSRLRKILEYLKIEEKEISLLLVDDEGITEINHQYLQRNRPTNVISFSMAEGEFGDINSHILGDIVISVETALKDADEGGIDIEDEIDYLMIHGLLHLLGYDHEDSDAEALLMKEKEKEIFFELKKYAIE